MRFWIVSPNVKRDSNANGWTASICRTNCAFMGWGPEQEDKRKGYDFHHTVRRGDVILVAHRNNWDWNCVVAGIVDSDDVYEVTPDVNEVPDCAWARHLSPVISSARLNELKLATLVKKIEGAPKAQIPGAIFELTDVETTNKLQSEFDRLRVEQQARGKIDMWTSLLENSKNLILTGAPGTGKLGRLKTKKTLLKKNGANSHSTLVLSSSIRPTTTPILWRVCGLRNPMPTIMSGLTEEMAFSRSFANGRCKIQTRILIALGIALS